MKNEIISNIQNPAQLEKLYRTNKSQFKQDFEAVYPDYSNETSARFWHERLNYESDNIFWGSREELLFVVIASLIAGILAKLPDIFPINEELFYTRNVSFLVFPFIAGYFVWKNRLSSKVIGILSGIAICCLLYINFLPKDLNSDSILLACLHLPLLLWVLLGVAFSGKEINNFEKRLHFLSFNGDLLVMSAILVLAGIITTGITVGLFELISLDIKTFYMRYVVIFCLPAIPIIATHLTRANPNLVNKVSPIIAKIFSPFVLVMLIIYLGAIIYSGKDLYSDRQFLIIFNILLVGVMALIFFSVAESWKTEKFVSSGFVLFPLSIVTIIINAIALSAIAFRISEWGLTPNRLAVLGSNILILVHLLMVTYGIFRVLFKKSSLSRVGKSIAGYLPVYLIWTLFVVFLFPIIFGFK